MNTTIYGSSANDGLLKSLGPHRLFASGSQSQYLMSYPVEMIGFPITEGEKVIFGELTTQYLENEIDPTKSKENPHKK